MAFSKNRVHWMGKNIWPAYVGFCPSKRAYEALLEEFKMDDPNGYPTADGRCVVYEHPKDGMIIIVCVGDHIDKKRDPMGVAALIAHESVHAKQFIFDDMGVQLDRVDKELEAYTVHHIFMHMTKMYHETRKRLW